MQKFHEFYNRFIESIFVSLKPSDVIVRQKDVVEMRDKNGKVWTVDELAEHIPKWNVLKQFAESFGYVPEDDREPTMWSEEITYDMADEFMIRMGIKTYDQHLDEISDMIYDNAIFPDDNRFKGMTWEEIANAEV